MKKLSLCILSAATVLGGMLLTSCLGGDGTNKYTISGIFTVGKEGESYVLYRDLGGVVYPSVQSVGDLTKNKINSGDRISIDFSYTDDNIVDMPGKGKYIKNAEIVQGVNLPKYDVLMTADAQAKNLFEADSIFPFFDAKKLVAGTDFFLWAYRGYLTVQFSGSYSIVKEEWKYPTLNMVFNPDERIPNALNLKMLYNRHTAKKDVQFGQRVFYATYPLSQFNSLIPGNDSIQVKVEGEGLKEPVTFRMSRQDLSTGNYLYY